MVGVYMGVDHVADFHTTFFRYAEIGLRIVNGVAHGTQTFTASTKHVGGSDDRIVVKQLTQDHRALLENDLSELSSNPAATGNPYARQS